MLKFLKYYAVIPLLVLCSCDYFFPPLSSDKIDVNEAYSYLAKHKGDPDVVLLDVRTREEYESAHLESAISLDYRQTSFPVEIEKLDRQKRYIIYSKTNVESFNSLELMKELRFEKMHAIQGGWQEWNRQKLPLNF